MVLSFDFGDRGLVLSVELVDPASRALGLLGRTTILRDCIADQLW